MMNVMIILICCFANLVWCASGQEQVVPGVTRAVLGPPHGVTKIANYIQLCKTSAKIIVQGDRSGVELVYYTM